MLYLSLIMCYTMNLSFIRAIRALFSCICLIILLGGKSYSKSLIIYQDNRDVLNEKLARIIKSNSIPQFQLNYSEPNFKYEVGIINPYFLDTAASAIVAVNEDDSTAIFQAASLSKVLFACIVLRMYERGEIDLDMPLYKYTDIDRFVDKEKAKKLTARIILQHRTGIKNWCASPSSDEWPTSPITFIREVDSCFGYSGEGIAFLQRAVESIKKKPIQKIAEEEIFIPLRMRHTAYDWIPCYDSLAVPGHNSEGVNRGTRKGLKANTAYTLRTNAKEYAYFLDMLFFGDLLKPQTKEMMFTPNKMNAIYNQQKPRSCDYKMYWGLGIGIEKNENHGDILWHWGDNGNFKALFIYIPKEKKRLVYFTNSAHGHDIIDSITSLFFNDLQPFYISSWINN